LSDPQRIVLASGSPRRLELLRAAGFDVEVLPPQGPEAIQDDKIGETPRELASRNARVKAAEIRALRPDSIVIAADTVVDVDGRVFGKPVDLAQAARMLGELQGRIHQVVTAVCIVRGPAICEFEEFTRVQFHPMTAGDICLYLERVAVLDKAGSYAAQEDDGTMIAQIEGSFTNVVGLPMERLQVALERHFLI